MVESFVPTKLYTVEEVAQSLQLKVSCIRDRVFYGTIPCIKLGKARRSPVRFYGADLNEWLEDQRRPGNLMQSNETENSLPSKVKRSSKKIMDDYSKFVEKLTDKV